MYLPAPLLCRCNTQLILCPGQWLAAPVLSLCLRVHAGPAAPLTASAPPAGWQLAQPLSGPDFAAARLQDRHIRMVKTRRGDAGVGCVVRTVAVVVSGDEHQGWRTGVAQG